MRVDICKNGHPFTLDNLEPWAWKNKSRRRCLTCARETSKLWKKRHAKGGRTKKDFCKNGHPRISENLRPGRTDCAICHREQQLKRNRKAGAKPLIHPTREQRLFMRRKWESTRKARRLASFIEVIEPAIVWKRDRGICGICKSIIKGQFEVDHIIPLARGGQHGYTNVQLAHPSCNRKKWALLNPPVAFA